MADVKLRERESIDEAIRRFTQKVHDDGVMEEIRKRAYYRPPSQKRKEKREKARRDRRLEERMVFDSTTHH